MNIDNLSKAISRRGALRAILGGSAAVMGLALFKEDAEAATCSRWFAIPTNGALSYKYNNWLAANCSFTSQGCYCGTAAYCTNVYPSNTPAGTILYNKPYNYCPF